MEPDQAAAEFEQLQRRLQALDQHMAGLERQLAEQGQALRTLDGLSDAADSLVPIGAGIRVPAQIHDGPVMMDVGAGYVIETDVDAARSGLQARREKTEAALRATSAEVDQLTQAMENLQRSFS